MVVSNFLHGRVADADDLHIFIRAAIEKRWSRIARQYFDVFVCRNVCDDHWDIVFGRSARHPQQTVAWSRCSQRNLYRWPSPYSPTAGPDNRPHQRSIASAQGTGDVHGYRFNGWRFDEAGYLAQATPGSYEILRLDGAALQRVGRRRH